MSVSAFETEPDSRAAAVAQLQAALRVLVEALPVLLAPPEPKPEPSTTLSFAEVARRLSCDRTHAARLARAGHLKLVALGSASPRVETASLEAFIKRGGIRLPRRRPSLLEEVTR